MFAMPLAMDPTVGMRCLSNTQPCSRRAAAVQLHVPSRTCLAAPPRRAPGHPCTRYVRLSHGMRVTTDTHIHIQTPASTLPFCRPLLASPAIPPPPLLRSLLPLAPHLPRSSCSCSYRSSAALLEQEVAHAPFLAALVVEQLAAPIGKARRGEEYVEY